MSFIFKSKDYNLIWNSKNGFTARWGKTQEDDPQFSPVGQEIADIEISTICNMNCPACYKSNTDCGENMSLETFKAVFEKLKQSKVFGQIAFGIGSLNGNPELFDIMQHCRDNGIVPNITINGLGLTDEYAQKLAILCGAVAVSYYDKETCLNAIKKLSECGLKQINIHALVSKETEKRCYEIIEDFDKDIRYEKVGAVVFLTLKKKGRGTELTYLSKESYKTLIDTALSKKMRIGFDSCSAHIVAPSLGPDFEVFREPCESTCFSIYVNTQGEVFPCSFLENETFQPISLLKVQDFMKDVWFSESVVAFRENLIKNGRKCPVYNLD